MESNHRLTLTKGEFCHLTKSAQKRGDELASHSFCEVSSFGTTAIELGAGLWNRTTMTAVRERRNAFIRAMQNLEEHRRIELRHLFRWYCFQDSGAPLPTALHLRLIEGVHPLHLSCPLYRACP